MSDLHVVHCSGFWPQLTTLLDTVYLFIETNKFWTEKKYSIDQSDPNCFFQPSMV